MNVTSIEVFPRRHRQTASGSALVARYNADGTADETAFHTSALTVAQAVAIQPVGTQSDIVVAGLATGSEFAMLRYLSNGSLDPSFVANFNAAASPFTGDSFTPERIAVQTDGEIVVAGYVASADGTDLGIARYLANGSLDTGFGVGGGVTAGLTVATTDPCGLAIGNDGSIVAACTVQTGTSDYAFGVVRLASDGTLDTSFNQSGEVTDDWGDSCNHATSVAIESDGSILVGGYDASVSGDYVDLVRFLPDGSLDPNFLYGQLAYEPLAGVAYSLAIQPNNMILVGGAFAEAVGERMDFGVARLMDSGAVDQNFGAGGVSAQNLGSGSQSAVTAVAVRPDGEILAAGVVGALPTGAPTAAAVDLYFGGEADGAIVRVDDDNAVDTNNPSPALPLSGDATVPANTPYTLTLGDGMAYLGSGSNVSYVVNWGDGNLDPPISADDLAAQGDQVAHTYTTTATDPITVDLDVANDPNSPYLVGRQPVSVDFSDVTTTSLDSIASPVDFGSSVALTATVSATGTPGGTVEFYDGTIDLGPGSLAMIGSHDQATLNTPPLTAGTHSFTAVYGGDGTFDESTAPAVTASVDTDAQGSLSITASQAQGSEYALTLPPTAGGEGITQWTIYWGDGTFTSINSTTQTPAQMETQTHTFANDSYTITAIAASSAGNFSASTSVTLDLSNHVAQGLSVSTSATYYSGYDTLDGGGAGVEISGSFSDPGALESHTVTIDWGDGSDPVSFQLDPGETTFDYPAPQYASSGTYSISVSVADAAGATSPSTVVVNYSNVAPSALALNLDQSTIYADGQVNLSGSFTDLQANIAHTITIDWGDVSASPRDITSLWLAAGETTFQADPHTYSATGNDSISVTVCGIDGSTTATTPVKVNSTTTTVVSSPTSPTYGQSVTFTATVASVVSGNGAPTGTVDFYDQTTGVDLGTATLQSNGTAALSISDLAVGGHAIVATYSGDDNFPTSQSASASVSVTGQTLSLTNVTVDSTVAKGGIATLSGNVANLDGAGFTLVVSWGANQGAADSITYPPGTTTFSITHHYVDAAGAAFAGTYAIAIQVTSSDGRTTAANKTISGHDAPVATVNIAGGPTSIQGGGQEVSVSAVVADPGENGSFTYSWSATDGNDTPQTGSSPTFNFNAASPASYSVSLTVTDADGNTASASVTIPYGGSSGCCGGSITPFQPDSPTVTIEECDAEGRPYSSAVPAGSSAYFQVSVGASNMPAHGDVNVFYNTQDGNAQGGGCPGGVAQADTDYTSTAGELTFTYATAYAPQIIEVDTSPTSSGGTFSMLATYFLDPSASTTNSAAAIMLSAVATIASQPVTGKLTIYKPGEGADAQYAIPPGENKTVGGLVVLPYNNKDPLGLRVAPMTVTLTSPGTVAGSFELDYNYNACAGEIGVYLDKACTELVLPNSTKIQANAGGVTVYVTSPWGIPSKSMCDNLITLEYVAPNGDIQTDLGTAALATFTVLSVEKPEVKFSGPVECQNPDVRTNMAALQPGRDVNQKYQLGPQQRGLNDYGYFFESSAVVSPANFAYKYASVQIAQDVHGMVYIVFPSRDPQKSPRNGRRGFTPDGHNDDPLTGVFTTLPNTSGEIFLEDAPGPDGSLLRPTGTVFRERLNFTDVVEIECASLAFDLDPAKHQGYEDISASTGFWIALSVKWDPTKRPVWVPVNDIAGDNRAGYGQISLEIKPISRTN